MERSNDYDYREIICNNPEKYCGVIRKLEKILNYEVKSVKSNTSRSYYLTVYDLNMKIRISNHDRMAWPPYKGTKPPKKWWEFWRL